MSASRVSDKQMDGGMAQRSLKSRSLTREEGGSGMQCRLLMLVRIGVGGFWICGCCTGTGYGLRTCAVFARPLQWVDSAGTCQEPWRLGGRGAAIASLAC